MYLDCIHKTIGYWPEYNNKHGTKCNSGPLHMSPITGLAWLQGRNLWSVHMANLSPVERDEIQETQPKWWNMNLYRSQLPWLCELL